MDAGATTLCVAGDADSATWATAAGGEDDEGEDIEAMSLAGLAELMEEVGGPALSGMSLAEAERDAWQFIEENFGAEEHDHDHDEEKKMTASPTSAAASTRETPNSTTWASRTSR